MIQNNEIPVLEENEEMQVIGFATRWLRVGSSVPIVGTGEATVPAMLSLVTGGDHGGTFVLW